MKLDTQIVEYIQNVVRVCRLVGIESVIIEEGLVRAIHPDRTVAIIHPNDVPDLPFKSIGLTRLATLQSRLDIVKSQPGYFVEVTTKPGIDYVIALQLIAKGIKVGYRCADPLRIEAKRKFNDGPQFRLTLSEHIVQMLSKGASAMDADKVTILSNDDGVSFELVDVNNDVFSQSFSQKAEVLVDDMESKFAHRYPLKLLLSVFKDNPTASFEICGSGAIKILLGGITTYVLPHAG